MRVQYFWLIRFKVRKETFLNETSKLIAGRRHKVCMAHFILSFVLENLALFLNIDGVAWVLERLNVVDLLQERPHVVV